MLSRRNLLCGVVALALCALLSSAKGKPGGKPGGGGGGGGSLTGTIYLTLDGRMYTMDPDGGNKTALPANVAGEPSRDLHGGRRWFLQMRGTVNGRQLFAQRDDGDEGVTVQLTTNPDLEVSRLPVSARWGVGDAEVSWIAQRTDIVEGGIYTADINFDASGNVTGLAAQPTGPLVAGNIILVNSETRPDIRSHDWSPDGNKIVHDTGQPKGTIAHQITIADVVAGTSTVHPTANQAAGPVWSPDGSKIAYGGKPIATINPDGSGEKTILRRFLGPNWSPTGVHLIFGNPAFVLDAERQDIYRSTAKGGSRANLTSELDTRWGSGTPADSVGWR